MSSPNLNTFTQSELYDALKMRQAWAYDHLYRELKNPFQYWVVRNNGSEMDAEDAFHKGLLNFLLNIETGKYQFQENAKITTVIFDYCKKVWLNELASSRLKTRTSLPDAYDPVHDTDLQKDLERHELVAQVRAALAHLKAECRQLIEWFYMDDLSLREIAEKLGMKESSTKQKRYDCTEKLKQLLLKQI
ncbi:RNA polymerase sigma factor (sigma-70 family) [Rhabdobacter roseus]|uniref:RNA polymerase sigma factor (Sigma-70 family) n=1 Tax=Rhabdobacter roseus TaxID=1655419 RepID=A0A840TI40_9BACT|nr:sigma-70 family RNA polymerase sigma factor [Rhabdobacter roseus]MBB5282615.1 RNA polymerase sigma factor (sigma-70 family) [Rhabdobacter roseus]